MMARRATTKAVKARKRPPLRGRRHGVGSIEELPSGRFRVRVRVNGEKVGDTHGTREEAEQQRAVLAVRHRAVVERLPPEPDVLTLAGWGETWLQRREELGTVRNARGDRTRWRQYLTGTALDGLAVEEIRGKHVAGWVNDLGKRPKNKGGGRLSPQTIRHAFNLLRLALADAVRDEHLERNPCDGVRLPKLRATTWAFLTAEEIAAVTRGAPGVPAEAVRVFVVAIYTGLREGELIALRREDVTLTGPRPELHVQRSHDGPPKSGKTRRVPLFDAALDALRAQWAHLGEGAPDDLVFPSARGHQRQPSDDFGWSSRKRRPGAPTGYREALGIARPVRFHELRHTCASHLAMGTWAPDPWPIQDVAAFMGHASLAMSQRYMHLSPEYLHARVRGPVEGRGTVEAPGTPSDVPRSTENTVRPARIERATYGLEGSRSTLENKLFSMPVGHSWTIGGAVALAHELLGAVDEGTPARELARRLALDVLRVAPADSAPWGRAIAVLEGGPLRVRHAVELAGLVIEAAGFTGEMMAG